MTKDELIKSLPADLRPWAEIWIPAMLRWSDAELAEFLRDAAGLPWLTAYKKMVDIMTVDEKITELKMRKADLARLNADNAAFVQSQRTLFFSVLAKLILSLVE